MPDFRLNLRMKEIFKFEDEHQLGTKPMAIDILIIKNTEGYKVKKNIGRIFRKYNIIEYKSPDDYLSIDDFTRYMGILVLQSGYTYSKSN